MNSTVTIENRSLFTLSKPKKPVVCLVRILV
uniref:Uncharacterized protein n=1 Tax=Arundo donax TaxID=35708 RepID=A0A0A9FUM8_ARUDO